jgi:hypothetical protein
MSEDETKRDDEQDDSEDRAVIIERRRLLVASALASVAMGTQACEQVKRVIGIADPQPCLSPPRPNVCLAYMPPQPEPQPQVCLSQRMVEPQSCLSVAPTEPPTPFADGDGGVVGTDLSHRAQPCLAAMDPRAEPRTCLSVSRPRVCLSARAPQPRRESDDPLNPFKRVDDDDG